MPSPSALSSTSGDSRIARLMALCLEVVALVVIAWLVARLVWFVAFGASPILTDLNFAPDASASSAQQRVIDRDSLIATTLFDVRGTQAVSTVQTVAPETALDLDLRGVRRGVGPDAGSAIIRTPDGRQLTLGVGQYVMEGVRLEAVFADRVTLRRNGVEESLFLREDRLIQPAPSSQATPTPPAPVSNVSEGPGVFEALEIIPERSGLEITGFRIGPESDAAVLEQTGLQVGDVVTAVNDVSFADPSAAFDVLEDLELARRAVLTIERNGVTQTIRVEMP